MTVLPATADRVTQNTAPEVNRRIADETAANVRCHGSDPQAIERRLAALDREWDIERAIEANASGLMLAGLALGALADRRWFLLPAAVASFLLQHALQGWCPPVPVLRRLGFRTQREIDAERTALKALRGDFEHLATADFGSPDARAQKAVAAARS